MTSCPSCSKQLKVPDELIGRQVKCPACGTQFTAMGASSPGAIPSADQPRLEPAVGQPGGGYAGYDDGGRRASGRPNPLFGPGIAMLISAILNLLAGGYLIVNGIFVMKNPQMALQANPFIQKDMTPEEKAQVQKAIEMAGPGYAIAGVLGILCAVIITLGAISMMRGKGGGLPWTAAVLSAIPCTAPCCCAGIPVGIWAMMALNKAGSA
jgi:predicted Zn finger-like uncharacterized protein